jgi:hypothetical protein
MAQQSGVPRTNTAGGSQFNRRSSLLIGYSNKSHKTFFSRMLIIGKRPPELCAWMVILSHLGRDLLPSWFVSNQRVASVVGRSIEQARVDGTYLNAVQESYTLYKRILRGFNIQPCNIWDIIALGVCVESCVLGSSSKKRSYVESPELRGWVKIIEIVSRPVDSSDPLSISRLYHHEVSPFPMIHLIDAINAGLANCWA